MDQFIKCNKCGNWYDTKFCSECGEKNQEYDKPIKEYGGTSINTGKYKVTCIAIDIFQSEDAAKDAVRHSCYNEDSEFDDYSIELIESTATIENGYIWICNNCYEVVSNHPDDYEGKLLCFECESTDWIKREK